MIPPLSDSDYLRGNPNAPLILVHYGDFECPFSRALAEILPKVEEEYGEKLGVVFRHFPLDFHPHGMSAALAAEAIAARCGDFWRVHDTLFANQTALKTENLESYAQEMGVSREDFRRELENPAHRQNIVASLEGAQREGAHGTPSVFLNGVFHDNNERLWKIERLRAILAA